MRAKDVARLAVARGCDRHIAYRPEVFDFLRQHDDCEVFEEDGRRDVVKFHVNNPTARWSGSGGYWVGVDINDCEETP